VDWDERVEIDGLISQVQGRMERAVPVAGEHARRWAELLAGRADPNRDSRREVVRPRSIAEAG
jgi:hypothetical protein